MITNIKSNSRNSRNFKEFRKLCFAELLFSTYVFSLLPQVFFLCGIGTLLHIALAFVIGILLEGVWNSWSVEYFSRKMLFLVGMMVALLPPVVMLVGLSDIWLCASFLFCGIGVAMVENAMCHTAANDLLCSENRTKGDSELFKYSHIGLPLGVLIGGFSFPAEDIRIIYVWITDLSRHWNGWMPIDVNVPHIISLIVGVAALLVAFRIHLSIKAPVNLRYWGMDRYWQRGAYPLVILTFLMALIEGVAVVLLLTTLWHDSFRVALYFLGGFVCWNMLHHALFQHADERAEFVVGCLALLAGGMLVEVASLSGFGIAYLKGGFMLLGWGIAATIGRMQMYFLKLDPHRNRATLQNTHFIVWEVGMIIGLLLATSWLSTILRQSGELAMSSYIEYAFCGLLGCIIIIVALVFYLSYVYRWYMNNKDREFKFKGY